MDRWNIFPNSAGSRSYLRLLTNDDSTCARKLIAESHFGGGDRGIGASSSSTVQADEAGADLRNLQLQGVVFHFAELEAAGTC